MVNKYPVTVERGIIQRAECSFRVKVMRNGNLITKTFDTLSEAKTYKNLTLASAALDVNESAIFESRAKKSEAKTFTLADAIKKYKTDFTQKKKGRKQEESMLNKLARSNLCSIPLYQFDSKKVIELLDYIKNSGRLSAVKNHIDSVASESTLKRYFNLIRHIFSVAENEWQKIEGNPCTKIAKSSRPRDGKPRDRRLLGNEYSLMLEALNTNEQAKIIFVLSVETAMRRGEIFNMRWEHLNLANRFLTIPDSKINEGRTIPLSLTAVEIFKSFKIQGIKGNIITISMSQLRYAWKIAKRKTGIENLRVHDMRHEATSRLIEKGFGDLEAAAVTGHKTLSMLKRYAHLRPNHLFEKLDAYYPDQATTS